MHQLHLRCVILQHQEHLHGGQRLRQPLVTLGPAVLHVALEGCVGGRPQLHDKQQSAITVRQNVHGLRAQHRGAEAFHRHGAELARVGGGSEHGGGQQGDSTGFGRVGAQSRNQDPPAR